MMIMIFLIYYFFRGRKTCRIDLVCIRIDEHLGCFGMYIALTALYALLAVLAALHS